MKKASKAMKKGMKRSMKAKKAMKKKSMKKKVSVFGKRRSVFSGKRVKTFGGLKKDDLRRNKAGKIVSKKASAAAKKRSGFKKVAAWGKAVSNARKALGIKGFCAVGGKSAKGQALLKKVRSLYRK